MHTILVTPKQTGDLDGATQVLRVGQADLGVGMQRVAVAVQPGQLHTGLGEHAQVLDLTTVRQDIPGTVDIALERLDEGRTEAKKVVLRTQLIVRGTTGPVRV